MSKRWIVVLAWVISIALIWAILIPQGLSWAGLIILTGLSLLALWAATWFGVEPTRSVAEVIDDTEAEPALAVAALGPSGPGVPVPDLRSKGDTHR